MDPKSKEFNSLQLKWYKRLRSKGFVDIEAPIRRHPTNKASTWYLDGRFTTQEFLEQQRYYQLASQALHEYPFASSLDKKIWRLHSEGIGINQIAEKVHKADQYVHSLIQTVAETFKSWT